LLETIEKNELYGEKVVFILDNLSSHKCKEIYSRFMNKINFLPPYSPMFNNIEYFFSLLKRSLKKRVFRSSDEILKGIDEFICTTDPDIYERINMHCIKLGIKLLSGE
jgi:transposase